MDKRQRKQQVMSGFKEFEIDGKMEQCLNIDGSLLIALKTACDYDGINILEMAEKYRNGFIPVFVNNEGLKRRYNNILNCNDIIKITHEMLYNEFATQQLLYAIRFGELVAKKVATPLNNKIKKLEQEYNSAVLKEKETNILWNSAIMNEAKANTELAKCKKKHDKEVRVLEHRIKELEEQLAQTNK